MKKLIGLVLALLCSMSMFADEHYLVGGCTDSGWNTGAWQRSAVAMVKVSENEWVWAGKLTTGEGDAGRFKIPDSGEGWDGYWAPAQGTVLTSEWSDLSTDGSGDYKFCVAEEGVYVVTINTSTSKIKAEKITEPSKDGDYYLLSSVPDYMWYAGFTTSNNQTAKARLTTDIDFTGAKFFPLSCDKYKFKGELDGAGHTIKGIYVIDDNSNIGLCRYIADGAHIHDIIIDGTFVGNSKVGGIAGFARDGGEVKLTNVINKAYVEAKGSSDANAAGFIGCAVDNTKITALNCANMGEVHGQDGQCAAFAGWTQNGTTFTNCWNGGTIYNMESNCNLYRNSGAVTATNCFDAEGADFYTQGTKVAKEKQATGEFCYILNGEQTQINWYQKLTDPADAFPVPFSTHGQVYANGEFNCDGSSKGTVVYSNENTGSLRDEHTNVDGFCSVCNAYYENWLTAVDDCYEISTPAQLRWMAESVNEHNSTYGNANIKLTNDIDYTAYTDQAAMFGKPSNTFKGVFDGQCHTVTVAFNNTTANETALFRRINGGTVKNLKVAGTITTNKSFAAGIVSGVWQNALIQNCEAAVTITDEQSGDGTHGGILARVSDKSNTNDGIKIYNCKFSGSIQAPNRTGSGGIIGWPDNSSAEVKIKNCLVTGTINLKDDNDNDLIVRNTATVENTYYTCELTNNLRNSKNAIAAAEGTPASGELCFNLNGKESGAERWYQTLSGETMPTPFYTSQKVYQNGEYKCDHVTAKGSSSFSNTEGATYDDHAFGENDLCTGCKAVGQEPGKAEDVYQIGNIGQLVWFSAHVNSGNTTSAADVTADIAQGDAIYTPIGSTDNPYKGVFKGGFHTITLDLSGNGGYANQGIFGVLTGGAEIYNLTSAGTIKGSAGVGGIAGSTSGSGDVKFINVGNEATVEATTANAGGILGVDMNSAAHINMTNVYSAGEIKGVKENGGLSGWAGNNPDIINAYSISTVTNGEQFIRCNGAGNFNNTYGKDQIPNNMLTSGELCAKLGDKNFRQVIGEGHPVFNSALPNVYGITVSAAGYATFVAPANVATLPEGVSAYAAQVKTNYVHLEPVTQVPANNAVVVKANEGTYYYNNAESATAIETNDLVAATTDITCDGTQYVLAKVSDVVGFYQAESGKTLAAGKGYLVVSTPTKAFYTFGEDEDVTSIEAVEAVPAGEAIYNLAGQRLAQPAKGVNIIGGKKYVVK